MELINTALLRAMTAVSGLRARLSEDRGQDLLEYALLGGLIAGAIIAVALLGFMTDGISNMASAIGDCIDFDTTTACTPI